MTLRLLDLCCGAGGCSMGYYLAATKLGLEIEITGVDEAPQPNYPFTFVKADAVEYLQRMQGQFDFIHASTPCQAHSHSTAPQRALGKVYPDITEPVRQLLYGHTAYAVMENVMQAPIEADVILNGPMFGLRVLRKRKFELINWWMLSDPVRKRQGTVKAGDYVSVFGHASVNSGTQRLKGFEHTTVLESWKAAMNVPWMKRDKEIAQSVPPEYTEYIGTHMFNHWLQRLYQSSALRGTKPST